MSYSDEHECHCENPRNPLEKLYLCGSELCKKLTSKSYRNGHSLETIVFSEENDEK